MKQIFKAIDPESDNKGINLCSLSLVLEQTFAAKSDQGSCQRREGIETYAGYKFVVDEIAPCEYTIFHLARGHRDNLS